MTRTHLDEWETRGKEAARDRFEGEYPFEPWPRGRDAKALVAGYAPSKHRTKQWPSEAQLEVWCSLCREACECFVLDALTLQANALIAMTISTSRLRVAASITSATLNANRPPGANGERVRDEHGYALDSPFSGRFKSCLPDSN